MATNAAMVLAKPAAMKSRDLAALLADRLAQHSDVTEATVADKVATILPSACASAVENAETLVGAKVLVIDDELSVRVGMRVLLESWGCRVAACNCLAEAQLLLDDASDVDLIVADFRLPRHENGIETVRRLRERLGDVPALMVSGDTAPERLREAQASGLPFLHKPVSPEKLRETMLAVLRRSKAEDAAALRAVRNKRGALS